MKQLIQLIKRYPPLYHAIRYRFYARYRSLRRKQIFQTIYESNYWDNTFSASGPGSSLEATEEIRSALPALVKRLGARSFLDIPCGDLRWMQHVLLTVERYIGADIVVPMIERNRVAFAGRGEFVLLDLLKDRLPQVDIIFCRDCLVHLSFRDIGLALNNIKRSSSKYLLTTTFPEHKENIDTVSPYWRALNLELPPFNLPAPIHLAKDFSARQKNDQGKYLGVWRIQDIRR
jgi:SAM-dependent methyltransferase